jgi:hypothetical protein
MLCTYKGYECFQHALPDTPTRRCREQHLAGIFSHSSIPWRALITACGRDGVSTRWGKGLAKMSGRSSTVPCMQHALDAPYRGAGYRASTTNTRWLEGLAGASDRQLCDRSSRLLAADAQARQTQTNACSQYRRAHSEAMASLVQCYTDSHR